MNNDEWIEKQVNFRFLDIKKNKAAILTCHQNIKTHIKTLAILLPGSNKFSKLNNLDNICQFDDNKQIYYIKDKHPDGRYSRDAQFANLCFSWKLNSSAFLTNWGDAQGWDYSVAVSELDELPIIQFSRRKFQRGRVVLFPLGHKYMGAGGANIPMNFDKMEFIKKQDKIVWRGRFSGVYSNWIDNFSWAIGITSRTRDISDTMKLNYENTCRYQFLKMMTSIKWADFGFNFSQDEINNIFESNWKTSFFSPHIKPKLSIAEQIKNKFILALPGNDYPSSLYWSLLSNSVVFLLENEWETALDTGLIPWIHYVPVKMCLEDVTKKFEKLNQDDELCLEIIHNAHEYMRRFLNHDLRDAVDYETLKLYQEMIIPVIDLNKKWSFAKPREK